MARHPSPQPTDVELEILRVLWQLGPSAAGQIHEAVAARKGTGYSTTLKMLQVMKDKGLISRDAGGRPQRYRPTAPAEDVQLGMLDDLVEKAFGGSARRLVMRALEARRVSPADLAEMQRLIAGAQAADKEGPARGAKDRKTR